MLKLKKLTIANKKGSISFFLFELKVMYLFKKKLTIPPTIKDTRFEFERSTLKALFKS